MLLMGKSTISMVIFNSSVSLPGHPIKDIPVGDEFLIHPMSHFFQRPHICLLVKTQLSSQVSWFNKVNKSH